MTVDNSTQSNPQWHPLAPLMTLAIIVGAIAATTNLRYSFHIAGGILIFISLIGALSIKHEADRKAQAKGIAFVFMLLLLELSGLIAATNDRTSTIFGINLFLVRYVYPFMPATFFWFSVNPRPLALLLLFVVLDLFGFGWLIYIGLFIIAYPFLLWSLVFISHVYTNKHTSSAPLMIFALGLGVIMFGQIQFRPNSSSADSSAKIGLIEYFNGASKSVTSPEDVNGSSNFSDDTDRPSTIPRSNQSIGKYPGIVHNETDSHSGNSRSYRMTKFPQHYSNLATGSSFTIGSSKSAVLSAMGTPTQVSGDVWSYESSTVTFDADKVIGFYESCLGRKLKVQMVSHSWSAAGKTGHFTLGSSKQDVLDVMGTPTQIAGDQWSYGSSTITFVNNRAIGFYESPLGARLKVQM